MTIPTHTTHTRARTGLTTNYTKNSTTTDTTTWCTTNNIFHHHLRRHTTFTITNRTCRHNTITFCEGTRKIETGTGISGGSNVPTQDGRRTGDPMAILEQVYVAITTTITPGSITRTSCTIGATVVICTKASVTIRVGTVHRLFPTVPVTGDLTRVSRMLVVVIITMYLTRFHRMFPPHRWAMKLVGWSIVGPTTVGFSLFPMRKVNPCQSRH